MSSDPRIPHGRAETSASIPEIGASNFFIGEHRENPGDACRPSDFCDPVNTRGPDVGHKPFATEKNGFAKSLGRKMRQSI